MTRLLGVLGALAAAATTEARYWLGMSDVEDSGMATIKNRAITITGAYLW